MDYQKTQHKTIQHNNFDTEMQHMKTQHKNIQNNCVELLSTFW